MSDPSPVRTARGRRARALAATAAALACAAAFAAAAVPAPTPELPPASLARLERSGGPLPADHAIAVRYAGTLELEGHFAKPHELRSYRSERRVVVAAPDLGREDWTLWSDGDTAGTTSTTLLLGERVLRRDEAGQPFRELRGREAHEAAYAIYAAAPPLAVAHVRSANGRGLQGGAMSAYQSQYLWPDSLGRGEWDLDSYDLPVFYSVLRADPRRGSIVQETRVVRSSTVDGRIWPDTLRTMGLPAGENWFLGERRTGLEDVPLSELAAPDSVRPAAPAADTAAKVVAMAPGAWAVELPDADTRSLAVEFSDHLVLLETSSDNVHGERLRAALAARFPGKPVRYVAFSHHHPDYTGGLRPFLADSARVVCAGGLAPFVDEIARYSFATAPDRLWALQPGGAAPRIDTLVAGRWRHADAANELVALDIGGRSNHTEHYLVFWLPRQKLLFEGDLGWFTRNGEVRASSRAGGLLQALAEAKIAPVTLVQSWPVTGNAASLPYATLRALVAARAKR